MAHPPTLHDMMCESGLGSDGDDDGDEDDEDDDDEDDDDGDDYDDFQRALNQCENHRHQSKRNRYMSPKISMYNWMYSDR